MKKMIIAVLVLLGFAACGWWLQRHAKPTPAKNPSAATPAESKVMNDWQRSIRLDQPVYHRLDEATRQRLQAEERKQRPEAGRN